MKSPAARTEIKIRTSSVGWEGVRLAVREHMSHRQPEFKELGMNGTSVRWGGGKGNSLGTGKDIVKRTRRRITRCRDAARLDGGLDLVGSSVIKVGTEL